MKQPKNYIGFICDHSGSMSSLANAAMKDFNINIQAVKEASTKEQQDTIVSVNRIGALGVGVVDRIIVNSNPHVLHPLTEWPTPGNTPLYDAIGDMVELFKSLPDANEPHVSFLAMVTTDGKEFGSTKYDSWGIRNMLKELQASERWTFVFRIPKGNYKEEIISLNVPKGNVQEWDTTVKGVEASTATTTQAFSQYYASRSAGAKSSTVFYADASNVSKQDIQKKLVDISKDVSLYVVPAYQNGIEIKDFVLKHRMQYLKGSAFYQLTKTEARVQHDKLIILRDKKDGKMYSGDEARNLIGLPVGSNARLHPGNHGGYDIFIQSTSVNRKLVQGTGVIYWEAIGKPFTDDDLAYLKPKTDNGVVQLASVPVSNKPTPSPLKAKKQKVVSQNTSTNMSRVRYHVAVVGVPYFNTREEARIAARKQGKRQYDVGPSAFPGQRYYVM